MPSSSAGQGTIFTVDEENEMERRRPIAIEECRSLLIKVRLIGEEITGIRGLLGRYLLPV